MPRKSSKSQVPAAAVVATPAIAAAPRGRASWSGMLRLSLVAVPVKAYPAASSTEAIHFNQLHADCGQRIAYEKHCPAHGAVDAAEIVKGYQYAPGQYVVIEASELESLRSAKDKALSLERFVDARDIDPLAFSGRCLYLLSESPAAQRPYLLLAQAMRERGKWAVGRVAMSSHRQVVVVRPHGRILAMDVLHDPGQLRSSAWLEAELQPLEANPEERLHPRSQAAIGAAATPAWTQPTGRAVRQASLMIQASNWYYTPPGSKRRAALFDEQGQQIRGKQNQSAAEQALARAKLADAQANGRSAGDETWLVARVCSEYIQYCERGLVAGAISEGHCRSAVAFLNDLCLYRGALPAAELKKAHVQEWLESHAGWRSPATCRSVLAIVLAAFNRAGEMFDIPDPLKGMKKPASKPRLQSFSSEDEQAMFDATEARFRNFLFAAIRTGLRPFSELARLTADHVEETERGMMWRVYATKTKKTRKIPVPAEIAVLTRQLTSTAPRGSGKPLFRNTKDKPWKRPNGVVRFIAIKRKLGWNLNPVKRSYSCYTCRHAFAHRMLSGHRNGGAGCSIETLAELIGDTPKTAFDHYGKEWGQHYHEPLWAAMGLGGAGRPVRAATADE